ncbi:hypothetical protein LZ32DRAFT_220221 [Colletotrichum eremochloae]|nr:hypothetical protein LZ32DRAFT_220221 [Colletotrichum eremochloae]
MKNCPILEILGLREKKMRHARMSAGQTPSISAEPLIICFYYVIIYVLYCWAKNLKHAGTGEGSRPPWSFCIIPLFPFRMRCACHSSDAAISVKSPYEVQREGGKER